MFSTMTITAPPLRPPSFSNASGLPPLPSGSAASASTTPARNYSTTAVRRIPDGFAWKASGIWQSWGLHGTVIKSTKGQATDYNITIELRLPLAWWFGSHVLNGELAISFPRQSTLTLRHPSYFAIARVLDYSHPFLQACESNSVAVVREMLRNGQGRPTDEDPDGHGPLWVRVEQAYI
jgi:hypothetical protein